MRIAHFLSYYPSPAGTTKAVGGLVRALARLGHQVEIWTYMSSGTAEDEACGVVVRSFSRDRLSRFVPSSELRQFVGKNAAKYDLAVLHGMFTPQLAALAFVLRRVSLPYLVAPHGSYHPDVLRKRRFVKTCYAPIERFMLNSSAGIQALAEKRIPELRRYGVTKPVFVVPNGFDMHEIRMAPVARQRGGIVKALFLGRVDIYGKGLDLLLEALSKIKTQISGKMTLSIVGPEWGKPGVLHQLARRLDVMELIQILGPEYSRPPVQIIGDYDLLILPSRYEGFGFTVLEAMLAETPIIVSRDTGTAEHVAAAGCGWVVEPDSQSIADTLLQCLDYTGDWIELGKKGRSYALANLTWDECARKASEMYRQIVEMGSR